MTVSLPVPKAKLIARNDQRHIIQRCVDERSSANAVSRLTHHTSRHAGRYGLQCIICNSACHPIGPGARNINEYNIRIA